MRILFVAPRFHTNQYQVIKTLHEENHDVFFHVSFIGPTEDHSLLTPVNYKQSYISKIMEKTFGNGGVKRPYYFPGVMSYWKAFQKLRPDLVVIRDPYKYFSLIVAFCAFFSATRIIFYTQEELYRPRKKTTYIKQSLTIKFFKAAWMTPIKGLQNGKGNKPEQMYYVPLPVPLQPLYNTRKELLVQVPKILMIGKYHQDRKKHLLLIDAISILKNKYKFEVTLVGECVIDEQLIKYKILKETIKRENLEGIISLQKNIPYAMIESLYNSHNIFVLPSINEPYPISISEAMSFGLPVICTDTCGARFDIRNGENGYVVKSDSLEELTAAMESILADKEKLREMSARSLEYVRENLSGSAFYERFSHMINNRFKLKSINPLKKVCRDKKVF